MEAKRARMVYELSPLKELVALRIVHCVWDRCTHDENGLLGEIPGYFRTKVFPNDMQVRYMQCVNRYLNDLRRVLPSDLVDYLTPAYHVKHSQTISWLRIYSATLNGQFVYIRDPQDTHWHKWEFPANSEFTDKTNTEFEMDLYHARILVDEIKELMRGHRKGREPCSHGMYAPSSVVYSMRPIPPGRSINICQFKDQTDYLFPPT